MFDTTLSCGLCENTLICIYGITSTGLMDGLSNCRNLLDLTQEAQSDPVLSTWINHDTVNLSMWLCRIPRSPHHCPSTWSDSVLNSWQHLFVSWTSPVVVPVPVSYDFEDEAKNRQRNQPAKLFPFLGNLLTWLKPFPRGQSCTLGFVYIPSLLATVEITSFVGSILSCWLNPHFRYTLSHVQIIKYHEVLVDSPILWNLTVLLDKSAVPVLLLQSPM